MPLNPFLLLLSSFLIVYFVTKWRYRPCGKKTLPPSPPKVPILGNLHQLSALTHRSLQSLGRKYGPVLLLHFGNKPVFIVQSAGVAMEIMKTNDLMFADKPTSRTTDKLFFDSKCHAPRPGLDVNTGDDIVAGGTDTASATLEWAMTELLRHPAVLKKLQNEVREVLEGKRDITDSDLEKMHYLKAVIKETLRYHVPVPFMARVARDNLKVSGYDIASGTLVIINAWAIGRDPASWSEPENFEPERFLNTPVDFRGQDFGLIPFGSGRRGCPGITFAMASVELVLANLMQKFNWDLPDGRKGEELDVMEHPGVTIHRKNPLFAIATDHC
ncbi:hypothetical protein F511_28106 [Dorcoceras hygrometricum]|uniref:Uncharacterized protein n=1 Tax=Dorcoceras hygrometricum TaxID=472368 RepID=A0A2Z7A984_9LAMI|nr:hypothetical protein F511_28106 [Dorcoceras hygrometricum]